MPASTVPCQYRTGRTLGSGTYAIVKEAIHIKTGKYYACKVINKKLMEGRENMVRNEIAVLKRISSGNRNVVTLHDYFETAHNLYLCFDLCTGGELFDRICAKGNYYEGTPAEDADIMIADFGLSRVMEGGIGGEKLNLLTEICGTPGYMAPEIFKKTGHGKPVDVWAMGVITYFLLAGYTPFDRESQQAEMEAIIAGDYKFEPQEYWANVSQTAREFIRWCLTIDPNQRPTASECLKHKWLASATPHFVPDPESPTGGPTDLLPHVKKAFNAKGLWRKAAFSIRALNRMTVLAGSGYNNHAEAQRLREDVATYKEESEKEKMEDASITHQHESDSNPPSPASPVHSSSAKGALTQGQKDAAKKQDDISVDNQNDQSLETMMAKTRLNEKDQEMDRQKSGQ
ncbi:kinase-like domain-containing protein [Lentinula boryana]|uniref:Kinase-like domain-containing protein n=1 Tax=Lentinula boryana TaxID=40481 RepID=A0ABQ8QFT9_9AGAR|nr:kinase-like domain-containing protein [Lentinula boryana]